MYILLDVQLLDIHFFIDFVTTEKLKWLILSVTNLEECQNMIMLFYEIIRRNPRCLQIMSSSNQFSLVEQRISDIKCL